MQQGFNWVDYVVIAILVLSGVTGLMRGAIKEIISILSWIAAFFVASLFAAPIANHFASSSETVSWLAFGLSFLCLFILILIAGAIISSVATRAVEGGGVSFINRLLGGLFGVARGFVMVVVLMFIVQLFPQTQQETWWMQSVFVNAFQPAVQWLAGMVMPSWESLKAEASTAFQNINAALQQGAEKVSNQ